MKILVTGATGFVGKHLLSALQGDALEVVVLSRRSQPQFPAGFRPAAVIPADLSDAAALAPAFEGVEVVVNLAAELRDAAKFESTNIAGVNNIIALAQQAGVRKIVHLSSVGVVGRQYAAKHTLVTEDSECHPQNEYERTKLESEKLLRTNWGDAPERLCILRPTNVFGEEHPRQALLNFLKTVRDGRKLICTKDALVNYVYVKDVAAAIRQFTLNPSRHTVYNVGQAMPFLDFYTMTAEQLGVKTNCKILPRWCFALPEAVGYLGRQGLKAQLRSLSNRVEYSEQRLRSETPALPVSGVREGLEKTIAAYRASQLI